MSKASLASWVVGSLSPGIHVDSAATRATTAAKMFQASLEEVQHSSTLCHSCLAYSASLGFRGKHLLGEGKVSLRHRHLPSCWTHAIAQKGASSWGSGAVPGFQLKNAVKST